MPRRDVILHEMAREEIEQLYDYIAARGGRDVAWSYVSGLRRYLEGLAEFPERGTVRMGSVPGLRLIGYRRSTTVAFVVGEDRIVILGIFHGGRLASPDLLKTRL